MPVLDASVLIEYLAGGERAEPARNRLLRAGERLWAPHLVDAEVGHVLRRAVRLGELSPTTARTTLDDLRSLPLVRAAHTELLERAWALRSDVTFYGALYLALAERLDMALVTCDARLDRVPGVRAVIELIR